jgi:membrane peptidoglycan carboxypeptidase
VSTAPSARERRGGGTSWRLLVRLSCLTVLLLVADIAMAPWNVRQEIAALRRGQLPENTSYMRAAADAGQPVVSFRPVRLADIAPVLSCAVVMAEDERYFERGPLPLDALRTLGRRMMQGDFSRGGSGIAQQLARNLFLSADRTPRRKAREIVLGYAMAREFPRVQLLEVYLNVVEWGRGTWGIEAASHRFAATPAAQLTPSQAVVLASFLPAPRRELQYATGPLASRRQEAIARKLWRARLLSDAEFAATLDRVREWRRAARETGDARAAWAAVERLMGPERPSFAAPPADRGALPLPRVCDARRRGT